jgi:hypothetical protein
MLGWWGGPVIVWLNGTFGAGKSTTAGELVELLARARLFDAEEVGYLLRRIPNLPVVGDSQLAAADILTRHFLLHADRETLVPRIERDTPGNGRWRLEHLPDYRVALSWLREDVEVVDH